MTGTRAAKRPAFARSSLSLNVWTLFSFLCDARPIVFLLYLWYVWPGTKKYENSAQNRISSFSLFWANLVCLYGLWPRTEKEKSNDSVIQEMIGHERSCDQDQFMVHSFLDNKDLQVAERVQILGPPKWLRNQALIGRPQEWNSVHALFSSLLHGPLDVFCLCGERSLWRRKKKEERRSHQASHAQISSSLILFIFIVWALWAWWALRAYAFLRDWLSKNNEWTGRRLHAVHRYAAVHQFLVHSQSLDTESPFTSFTPTLHFLRDRPGQR